MHLDLQGKKSTDDTMMKPARKIGAREAKPLDYNTVPSAVTSRITTPSPVMTVIMTTTARPGLSRSTMAGLASVITFLALCLIALAGAWYIRYRRSRNRKKAPSAAFTNSATEKDGRATIFSQDVKSPLPLSPRSGIASPVPSNPWRTPNSATAFRISNQSAEDPDKDLEMDIEGGYSLASPRSAKSDMEKQRPSRLKFHSLMGPTNPEELVTPPPSYTMSSASGEPTSLNPPPKAKQKPWSRPGSWKKKSYVSTTKGKEKAKDEEPEGDGEPDSADSMDGVSQFLTIATGGESMPVISPARTDSFVLKDFTFPLLPPPVAVPPLPLDLTLTSPRSERTSSIGPPPTSPAQSVISSFAGAKLPRLMTVVAPYVPSLPDELRVKVGDTLRVYHVYNDGWCYVQFVGKVDAQKGMIPLICLQERQRIVPPPSSVSSFPSLAGASSSWR